MKPLYDDEFWDVEIAWKRPKPYERLVSEGSEHDDKAQLYLITARFSDRQSKNKYIGKTWAQSVSIRLTQRDHKKRYAAFVGHHPKHRFCVSLGIVTIKNGKLTKKRLSDIEQILIYSNDPDHAGNVKNFYNHGVAGSYSILNTGSRGSLPKKIQLGVFATY